MGRGTNDDLRALPPAHALLESKPAQTLATLLPGDAVRDAVRRIVEQLRDELTNGRAKPDRDALTTRALTLLEAEVSRARVPRLRRVINATGVVLHTNLGRAPLGDDVLRHVAAVAQGYATLEYDLAAGRRGHRDRLVSSLCASLSGAEDALVVNNNAAAVLLVTTALAVGREVVVSRGELVEIGGGFRIPEIIAACGAVLREVGTTNRTRREDYERAIGPSTAMLLKVHKSNFAVQGFVADVAVRELAALGKEHKIPVVEDLGSGALVDTAAFGIAHEPTPGDGIRAGADLVTISGDKLLGGPQAGIIVGAKEWIEKLRKHPLARALRPGRIVFAALEATLRIYAEGRAADSLPTVKMLATPPEVVRARAARLDAMTRGRIDPDTASRVKFEVRASEGRVGGGAMPEARLPSFALVFETGDDGRARAFERALRERTDPPVIARITGGAVWLDARTIADDEVPAVARGLARAFAEIQEMGAGSETLSGAGAPVEPSLDEEG